MPDRHIEAGQSNSNDMQLRAYRAWAHIYDYLYSWFLAPAHRAIAKTASGTDILEVGVGTGLLLRYYDRGSRVIGVDLSPDMLSKAREKQAGLPHVVALREMDATRLMFADSSVDTVVMPFVITLIPNARAALDEARRVLRPGGQVIIASKLASSSSWIAWFENRLNTMFNMVGWSASFPQEAIETWSASHDDMTIAGIASLPPFGMFKLITINKH